MNSAPASAGAFDSWSRLTLKYCGFQILLRYKLEVARKTDRYFSFTLLIAASISSRVLGSNSFSSAISRAFMASEVLN